MNGYELTEALNATLSACQDAIADCVKEGVAKARTASAYRSALAAKMLQLRDEGMPATMVKDIAKGDGAVNEAAFQAECAEAVYDAARETVMLRKREADVLREQISREWTQSGWRNG